MTTRDRVYLRDVLTPDRVDEIMARVLAKQMDKLLHGTRPAMMVDYLPATEARPAGMRYVFGRFWDMPGDGFPFKLQDSEIKGWAWCSPQEQHFRQNPHAPILSRRVQAARAAIYGGRTVYLENGYEVRQS